MITFILNEQFWMPQRCITMDYAIMIFFCKSDVVIVIYFFRDHIYGIKDDNEYS